MPTDIAWCDETINPVVGCSKVSAGCQNCYAEGMARRLAAMGKEHYQSVVSGDHWSGATAFRPSELEKPFRWTKPRTIFVCSMGDIFHDSVNFEWVECVMRAVLDNQQHTFVMLTKRPERMRRFFEYYYETVCMSTRGKGIPNLIIGVSVEDQTAADERVPVLLQIPAAMRFVSLEPMVGPVDLRGWIDYCPHCGYSGIIREKSLHSRCGKEAGISGIILGGESGPKARPMHPGWVRSVRDQCAAAGVPFMFKQWGEWRPRVGEWEPRPFGIFPDGRYYQCGLLMGPINAEAVEIGKRHAGQQYDFIHRVGKNEAGSLIDGRYHTELAWSLRKGAK